MTGDRRPIRCDATALPATLCAAAELAGDAIRAIAGGDSAAAWSKADASPLTQADLSCSSLPRDAWAAAARALA